MDYAFDNYKKVELTADDLSIRSISFKLEEGQKTAATASILTTEESVYYLPTGLSAEDYTLTFNYTESGNQMDGFEPKAIITLLNPVSGVPSTIEVPLSSTITAAAQMADVEKPEEDQKDAKKEGGIVHIILNVLKWVVIVVLALVALILAIRTWNIYNRRKKRRLRMERQRQMQRSGMTSRQYRNDVNVGRRRVNAPRTRSKIDIPIDRDSRY